MKEKNWTSKEKNYAKLFFVLLFLFPYIFSSETHTNKDRNFKFIKLLDFSSISPPNYSQFRHSTMGGDESSANFAIFLSRNDFKSTKRRSMKNIFTNTDEDSLSWPTADLGWVGSEVAGVLRGIWRCWDWRRSEKKAGKGKNGKFPWSNSCGRRLHHFLSLPKSSSCHFLKAFAKVLKNRTNIDTISWKPGWNSWKFFMTFEEVSIFMNFQRFKLKTIVKHLKIPTKTWISTSPHLRHLTQWL
jgi:hypothetical protein